VASPRSTEAVPTTLATPGVRSTMCPLPGVSVRRSPPWTATSHHAHAREAPLAELQHPAIEL
jgi:hypothetical protein